MDTAKEVESRGQELALRYMALQKEVEDIRAELYTVMGRLVRPVLRSKLDQVRDPGLLEAGVLDEGDLLAHVHMAACMALDSNGFSELHEFKAWVTDIADTEVKESLVSLGLAQ